MKIFVSFLAFFIFSIASASETMRPCARPTVDEPQTSRSDWRLIEKFDDMKMLYENLYSSGKRIRGRAYWDENLGSYVFPSNKTPVKINAIFLSHLTEQIEAILDRGYGDFLFYPDVGHVHLYATLEDAKDLQAIPDSDRRFEATMALPRLATVFHTAELIRLREGDMFDGPLVNDPWLNWRYYSRNIRGNNADGKNLQVLFAKGERYNTVRGLDGHTERTAIYFSASKDGCFSVNTKKGFVSFDISDR